MLSILTYPLLVDHLRTRHQLIEVHNVLYELPPNTLIDTITYIIVDLLLTSLTSAGDTLEREGEKWIPRAFNTVVNTLLLKG